MFPLSVVTSLKIQVSINIIEDYIISGGTEFLNKYASLLVKLLDYIVGNVNDKGLLSTLPIIDILIQVCFSVTNLHHFLSWGNGFIQFRPECHRRSCDHSLESTNYAMLGDQPFELGCLVITRQHIQLESVNGFSTHFPLFYFYFIPMCNQVTALHYLKKKFNSFKKNMG